MKRNQILALVLAALIMSPIITILTAVAYADEETSDDVEGWPVEPRREGMWYKFETPLITLLFPASGKKPMFIWWYTNDSNEIYIVKFKGVIEYLSFDLPYYVRRYHADDQIIIEKLRKKFIEPKVNKLPQYLRQRIQKRIEDMKHHIAVWFGLHPAFLPFAAGSWELEDPKLVTEGDVSYWAFNFTLTNVPMSAFHFAKDNIQIRCRFYNTTTTKVIDENHNYTVAAGQLKFDFIVQNWKWNIDKINPFLKELKDDYDIEIPPHRTGLALWMNLASIRIEDLNYVENEVQNQNQDLVEAKSQMLGAMINNQYYSVNKNQTALGKDERPIQLTNQLRKQARIHFARKEKTLAGFLEFVPWARLLNETGDLVRYVNVTASYIAAGGHMRLFLCYPYFGNNTLEHDPTIGLASALPLPTLITPKLLGALVITTVAIATAVAALKWKRKTINVVGVR